MPQAKTETAYQLLSTWSIATVIKFVPDAKKPGTKSYERYQEYAKARTVGEALFYGATCPDLLHDLCKKYLIPNRDQRRTVKNAVGGQAEEEKLKRFIACMRGPSGTNIKLKQKKKIKAMQQLSKMGIDLKQFTGERHCKETNELQAQRLAADLAAHELLIKAEKARRKITDKDITEVLDLWAFVKNETRQNVLPQNKSWVHSDTLGLIRDRTGTYMTTAPARDYPHFIKILCKWLSDQRPPELSVDFPFTTISLNYGYSAKRHRDAGNHGPSMAKAFGNFKGGHLCYWPDDDKSLPLDQLRDEDKVRIDTSSNLCVFDGNRAHEVEDFKGERYSMVFFSVGKYWKASQEVQSQLIDRGFPVPTDESMAEATALLPPPRGYSHQGQSLSAMFGLKEKMKVLSWPTVAGEAAKRHASTASESTEGSQGESTERAGSCSSKAKEGSARSIVSFFQARKPGTEGREEQSPERSPAMRDASVSESRGDVSSTPPCKDSKGIQSPAKVMGLSGHKLKQKLKRAEVRRQQSTQAKNDEAEAPPAKKARTVPEAQKATAAIPALSSSLTAADLATPRFNPEQTSNGAVWSSELLLLARSLQAAELCPAAPSMGLTNYFRALLHASANPVADMKLSLGLLLPLEPLPRPIISVAVLEAFGGKPLALQEDIGDIAAARRRDQKESSTDELPAMSLADVEEARVASTAELSKAQTSGQSGLSTAVTQAAAQPLAKLLLASSRDGHEAAFLIRLLLGGPGLQHSVKLCAVAHAFALTMPPRPCGASAALRPHLNPEARQALLLAMDRAVGLAYGEVGGSVDSLLAALFADCQPQQFLRQCGPVCGTPLLPMTAASYANLECVLLRLAGSAVLVEERYKGARVQIHKNGKVIRFFGSDLKQLSGSQNKALFSAVQSSLQNDCILDAVLQRPAQPASRSKSSNGAAKEVLWAFDCLCLNGKPLTRRSLRHRRQALAEVVKPHALFQAAPCEHFEAEAPPASELLTELLKEAAITGSGGVMLKRLESEYEAGRSSQAWMAVTRP
eukprot:CAMPEP_0172805518 /NCGR_PEP_ID=MMETSP1075-20121228/5797_1 /TAXON_ID=2916 /ORGANISM="Ceratium fusus, Strain PA161109" /LENGTH=1029 /DNA_ID=CAMNT_0013644203 /DNA_START=25 /DNA_END=3114 /DNA_ORIENTATION=+